MFDYFITKDIAKADAGVDFLSKDIKSGNGTLVLVHLKTTEAFEHNATYVLLKNIPSTVKYCSPIQFLKPDGTINTFSLGNTVTINNAERQITLKLEDNNRSALAEGTILSFLLVLEVAK